MALGSAWDAGKVMVKPFIVGPEDPPFDEYPSGIKPTRYMANVLYGHIQLLRHDLRLLDLSRRPSWYAAWTLKDFCNAAQIQLIIWSRTTHDRQRVIKSKPRSWPPKK